MRFCLKQQMYSEILRPSTGLSKNMSEWDKFSLAISNERQTAALRIGISRNYQAQRIEKHLKNLEQIFQHPSEFTVETRLAAIAMMHHLLQNPSLRSATIDLMRKLFKEKYSFFEHESALMLSIFNPFMKKSENVHMRAQSMNF